MRYGCVTPRCCVHGAEDLAPDLAVVEQVFVASSPRSALILGQARGVALAAVAAAGLPVEEMSAREIKQAVVGTGAAAKAQVQVMVKRILDRCGETGAVE